MEKRAMVRFFTLKDLNPGDSHAEFVSVYGPMHSFCKHSINGTSASLKGERSFSMIRDLGDPYRMISSKSFALCFNNVLLLHARDFVPILDLRRLRACTYYMTFAVKKVQFTLDFAHFWQQSKNRTGCIFFGTIRSSDEPKTE
jgi:hypothetical protein